MARRADQISRAPIGDLSVASLPAAPPLAAAAPLSGRSRSSLPRVRRALDDAAERNREMRGPDMRGPDIHSRDTHGHDVHGQDVHRQDGHRQDVHGSDVPSVGRRSAAEIASPGAEAAARFRATLQRMPASSTPLPSRWKPLATAIVGDRPVRVSTGSASRAALRAAGKVAATTGDVVHLARPLRGDADAPLLAHELAHVANPSPEPRFFDDHRDSAEERRARLVADVIRRSPVLPRASAGPTAPGAPIRRRLGAAPPLTSLATGRASGHSSSASAPSGSFTSSSTAASTTISAASLAARISGSSTPQVQRATSGASRSGADTTINRFSNPNTDSAPQDVDGNPAQMSRGELSTLRGTFPMLSRELDSTSLTDFVDWIMEQLEDRIGRELERRGGRYRGEF